MISIHWTVPPVVSGIGSDSSTQSQKLKKLGEVRHMICNYLKMLSDMIDNGAST